MGDISNIITISVSGTEKFSEGFADNPSYEPVMISFNNGVTEKNKQQLKKYGIEEMKIIKGDTPPDYIVIGYLRKGLLETVKNLPDVCLACRPEKAAPANLY